MYCRAINRWSLLPSGRRKYGTVDCRSSNGPYGDHATAWRSHTGTWFLNAGRAASVSYQRCSSGKALRSMERRPPYLASSMKSLRGGVERQVAGRGTDYLCRSSIQRINSGVSAGSMSRLYTSPVCPLRANTQ